MVLALHSGIVGGLLGLCVIIVLFVLAIWISLNEMDKFK